MKRQQWWISLGLCLVVGLALVLTAGTAMAQTKGEVCDNGKDDDGDKLVDCDDTECDCKPTGTPCSPGYWKNHLDEFYIYCAAAANLDLTEELNTCDELLMALTCKGSDASCLRSVAAALMNSVSGCIE